MIDFGFAIKDEVASTPNQGAGSPNHCHSHCLIVGALGRIPMIKLRLTRSVPKFVYEGLNGSIRFR